MNLPQELLGLIAGYICSKNDLIQCLYVCRNWSLVFEPYLYQNICFKNRRQFRQFKNTITNKPNSLYVKYIRFEDDLGLSRDEFDLLPILLPNVESIYFHPRVWKYQRTSEATSYWNRLTELPPLINIPLTYTLLQLHGHRLERLVLTAGLVNQVHSIDNNLIGLLESTRLLKSLRIIGYNGRETTRRTEFTLTDLFNIHSCLRELEHLDLSDVSLTRIKLPEIQKLLVEPMKCLTVKSFYLKGSVNDVEWMTFLASAYPNVSTLILNAVWSTAYKNRMTLQEQQVVKQSLRKIGKDYCCLEQIRIGDISGVIKQADQALFDGISSHCKANLTTLDCTQTSIQNTSKETFDALVRCASFSLSTLKMQLWRDIPNFEKVINSLPYHSLENLELSCGKYAYSWNYGCEIDTILMHCSRLKTLKLINARMTRAGHKTENKSGLHSLVLDKVHFLTDAFDAIATMCPGLVHLEMEHCVKYKDKLSQQIRIALPDAQLDSLVIHHLHLRPSAYIEKCGIDAAFLALDLFDRDEQTRSRRKIKGKMTRVYHLSNKSQGTLHMRYLARMDPQDAYLVQSYVMTKRDWDILEENVVRGTYRKHQYWKNDIPYGYIHIQCKSIRKLVFNKVIY